MILIKVPAPFAVVVAMIILVCLSAIIIFFGIRYIMKLPKIPKDARELDFHRSFDHLENNMKTQLKSEPV